MSQLIIVSNRLPVSVKKENGQLTFYPSLGGLATGLSSYVKNSNNLWIGWPGLPSDGLSDNEKHQIVTELAKHNCAPVFLTKKQLDAYYNGFSNTVLWPLCHNLRVPSSNSHEHWWRTYRNVNQLFTDTIVSLSTSKSTIWVHDYQLLLVPSMLRQEKITGHIGFFMHIPFPDYRGFKKLPEAKRVLEGLLGADLIGFHTNNYVSNFIDNIQRYLPNNIEDNKVFVNNRRVRITAFPMGIDYEKYAAASKSKVVKDAAKKYKRKYKGSRLIATVDRLDPSKGLVERLQAYKEFLIQNPQLRGKVILCMVAAPSRTEVAAYKNLKKRLITLVTNINQEFGTPHWLPVDYIEGLPFEEVIALFRVADIAFIAPLRDGMNLVAKEFIASKEKDGILILSETAGAAQELQDAIIVNPKNTNEVVAALEQALSMPKHELRRRLKHMQEHLALNTVHTWANGFMQTLNQPFPSPYKTIRRLTTNATKKLINNYVEAKKRLIILDYDGTLMPYADNYEDVQPNLEVIELLQDLASDNRNEVVLISGRSKEDLDKWLSDLPINLIAEHGVYTKKKGHKTWQSSAIPSSNDWKENIIPILNFYTQKTPGAKIEEKAQSVVWHYRKSPPYYAQKYAVIIKRTLKPLIKKYHLEIFNGNKILEIRDPKLNKGSAIKPWLKKAYDLILAIGDDYTDETMFEALQNYSNSYTIKVGPGSSVADFRIKSSSEVYDLLIQLS